MGRGVNAKNQGESPRLTTGLISMICPAEPLWKVRDAVGDGL